MRYLPYRVLIHALDPVLVCQKIAYTKIDKVVNPEELISKTITGVKGIGGVEKQKANIGIRISQRTL